MWFRNLQIYRLTAPLSLTGEELHAQLSARPSRNCSSHELWCEGWEPPLGRHGSQLTHTVGSCSMICLRREERLLPATVVNEQLAQRIAEIEEQQARKVRRRERNELKEDLVLELTPQALTRSRLTHAYIDRNNDWLIVDAVSAKRAEEVIDLLRETLGTLKAVPLAVALSPVATMTAWLKKPRSLPSQLLLGDECELRDPADEGGVVRCRKQDLSSEEIGTHLRAGKQVVQMSLAWQDRLAFVLTEKLELKRLKFLELIQQEAAESEAEDAASRFDVDFALMSLELANFLPALIGIFGGEAAT
ncbi:MAG: recombination-associated protein RdgC [Gammaproteobacteria bacterium]|nr:recombination-associated protein RdgC [Gammaproteobacteria bacterium]